MQFGQPLAKQQGIQWKLADMAIDIEAGRALFIARRDAAEAGRRRRRRIDHQGVRQPDVAPCHQPGDAVAGAYGLSEEFPLERMVRDVRGLSIGYGTTEIHRNTIAHEILEGRYVVVN